MRGGARGHSVVVPAIATSVERNDESGAVLSMVAISLTLLMAVAAFVVDLGFLRVARRTCRRRLPTWLLRMWLGSWMLGPRPS